MQLQSAVGLLSMLAVPAPPGESGEAYLRVYDSYLKAFASCKEERGRCLKVVEQVAASSVGGAASVLGVGMGVAAGVAETVTTWTADVLASEGVQGVKDCLNSPSECTQKGVHYVRNRRRKDRKREEKSKQKAPTVADLQLEVDVAKLECAKRMAEETLALRRAAENRVAEALAGHKLESLRDASKTDAVKRLEEARMEERINTAKAKSQASFKKCDSSLKSLGSAGSAGEFSLKREAKRAQDLSAKYKYLEQQLELAFKDTTEETRKRIAALPRPVFESSVDLFGQCPSDFDEDEAEGYYARLAMDDEENDLF